MVKMAVLFAIKSKLQINPKISAFCIPNWAAQVCILQKSINCQLNQALASIYESETKIVVMFNLGKPVFILSAVDIVPECVRLVHYRAAKKERERGHPSFVNVLHINHQYNDSSP